MKMITQSLQCTLLVTYDHLLLCCAFAADPGFERDSYNLSEIVGYRVFTVRH